MESKSTSVEDRATAATSTGRIQYLRKLVQSTNLDQLAFPQTVNKCSKTKPVGEPPVWTLALTGRDG